MKRQTGWMWMAACGVGLLAAAARAEVVNGHFEDPSDLYGWTVEGPVTVERVGSTATLPPNRLAPGATGGPYASVQPTTMPGCQRTKLANRKRHQTRTIARRN